MEEFENAYAEDFLNEFTVWWSEYNSLLGALEWHRNQMDRGEQIALALFSADTIYPPQYYESDPF